MARRRAVLHRLENEPTTGATGHQGGPRRLAGARRPACRRPASFSGEKVFGNDSDTTTASTAPQAPRPRSPVVPIGSEKQSGLHTGAGSTSDDGALDTPPPAQRRRLWENPAPTTTTARMTCATMSGASRIRPVLRALLSGRRSCASTRCTPPSSSGCGTSTTWHRSTGSLRRLSPPDERATTVPFQHPRARRRLRLPHGPRPLRLRCRRAGRGGAACSAPRPPGRAARRAARALESARHDAPPTLRKPDARVVRPLPPLEAGRGARRGSLRRFLGHTAPARRAEHGARDGPRSPTCAAPPRCRGDRVDATAVVVVVAVETPAAPIPSPPPAHAPAPDRVHPPFAGSAEPPLPLPLRSRSASAPAPAPRSGPGAWLAGRARPARGRRRFHDAG